MSSAGSPTPPQSASERRVEPRLRVLLPRVAFAVLHGEAPLLVRLIDLSRTGVRVLVPTAHFRRWPALGSAALSLQLNFDGDLVLMVPAAVVWFGGLAHGRDRVTYSGLRFGSVCPELELQLAEARARVASAASGQKADLTEGLA